MPTSDRPQVPAADELLRHAQWMRALARSLVLDDATADDVTQDAWVVALERPPRAMTALRGWLASVVRTVVLQRARGESRRRRREQAAATHEALDATDDVVSRAGIHRRLVDAVLELDEPYRSTLLLRFFDGLAPRAIAERKGLPDATVRSHLKRGLDRLRERFDAEHRGDRRAWVALLQPLALAKPASLTLPGLPGLSKGILMGTKVKVALVTAAVVAGVGVALLVAPRIAVREGAAPTAAPSVAMTSTATEAAAPSQLSAVEPDRTEASAPATPLAGMPVRFVYGAVVDQEARPIEKGELRLWQYDATEPGMPTSAHVWAESVKDGVYAIAGLAPGRWHLGLTAPTHRSEERDFEIGADSQGVRIDFIAGHSTAIPVLLRTPDGRRLLDQCPDHPEPGKPHRCSLALLNVAAFSQQPPDRLAAADHHSLVQLSLGRFLPKQGLPIPSFEKPPKIPDDADGALVTDSSPPFWLALLLQNVVLAKVPVADPTAAVKLVADPKDLAAALATLRVRIVDPETGGALARVQLSLTDQAGWWEAQALSDERGIATFRDVPPGILALEHLCTDREEFNQYVRIESGSECEVGPLPLSKPVDLEGRVVDDRGAPLKASIEAVDLERRLPHAPQIEAVTLQTDAEGRFHSEFQKLGRSRYLLVVRAEDRARTGVVVDTRSGSPAPLEIRVPRGTAVTFRWSKPELPLVYEITDGEGIPLFAGRGLWTERLAPGKYVVSAWLGPQLVASVPIQVGSVALAIDAPGEVAGTDGDRRGGPTKPSSGACATLSRLDRDPVGDVSFGTVAEESGAPIEGGELTATRLDGGERSTTIHHGVYAVAGLGLSNVEWCAHSPDSRWYFGWLGLLGPAKPERHDLVLALDHQAEARRFTPKKGEPPWQTCTLRLRLVDAATGAPLAPSLLLPSGGEMIFAPDRPVKPTEADGTFVLKGAPCSQAELVVRVPKYGQSRIRYDLAPGSDNDLGTLALAPAVKIAGRIVDEAGDPVIARVTAEAADVSIAGGLTLTTHVFSNKNGDFELEVGRGRQRLVVRERQFVPLSRVVDAEGDETTPIKLELVRGIPVAVRIDERLKADAVAIECTGGGTEIRRPRYAAALRTRLAPGDYVAVAFDGETRACEQRFTVADAPQLITLASREKSPKDAPPH